MSHTWRWGGVWNDESRGWEDQGGSRRYLSDLHSLPFSLEAKSTVDKVVHAALSPCLWQLGFSTGHPDKALTKP